MKLGTIERPDLHDTLCTVVQRWAKQDAAAALAFGEQHPDYLPSVLEGWTVADPDAAVSWMRERQESLGAFQIERMIEIIAKTHPKQAGRFVELVENKNNFYASQAIGLAEEPVAEIAAWLETVPEEWRKDAYVALCTSFSNNSDPEKAASLCMTFPEFASIEYSDQSLIAWSRQDAMAAIRHFQAGDIPPAVTERVLPELVDAWMRVDRKAALAFIATQPPSETLGRTMLDATLIIQEGDHEASRDFAMSLPALSMRIGACRQILSKADMLEAEKARWTASIPDAAVREALLLPPPAKPEETQTEGKAPSSDPFTNDP